MTSLVTFSQRRFPNLAAANIEVVQAGTLFYLFRGRNAWHGTWVQHYTEGSLSTSLAAAQRVAEQWRAQGSVFTIDEHPALICGTSLGTLAVTQINTKRPLWNLAKRRGAETAISEIQERILSKEPPTSVEQLTSMLTAAAKYSWSPLCPPKSLIMVATDLPHVDIVRLRTRNLKSWRSSSLGPQYYLSWTERSSEIKPSPILRIAGWSHSSTK
jgi:hypothetical protein